MTRPPAAVVAAAGLTALVAAAAFAISFASLTFVGRTAGVSDALSPLFPVCVDALLAVGVLAAVVLRHGPLRSRLFVWLLIGAAVAVSVAGNVAHARHGGGTGWAVAAGAVPPLALTVCLELLVMLVRHSRQPDSARRVATQRNATARPVAPPPAGMRPFEVRNPSSFDKAAANGHAKRTVPPADTDWAALAVAYKTGHPDATRTEVATALGCSMKTLQRRWPDPAKVQT